MCSPLAGNFWSTPVLVHKGLIHGVMTSLPWQTGLQSWQSCTIPLVHSVGYKWRSYQDSPSEGVISYMWIQSDSDLRSLINFQGVCVTRLMCSPLAGNFWSTPVLVHKGLIQGVMTSLPWQTGLQSWQSCIIALAHSVGYIKIHKIMVCSPRIYKVGVSKTNILGAVCTNACWPQWGSDQVWKVSGVEVSNNTHRTKCGAGSDQDCKMFADLATNCTKCTISTNH